jgi:ABC-type nitrate/sulfonate/bicarbonate transport system substrate-binding protein
MTTIDTWLASPFRPWLLAAALLPCAGCDPAQSERDAPMPRIVVAVYDGDVSCLVYLAAERGYFKDNGLEVALKHFEAGKLATDDMLRGHADVSTAGEFVFITNKAKHDSLRFFGTVSVFRIDELIARRDRGILKPADLRGKKIGVLRQATSEFFLGRFLDFHFLAPEDVTIVDLKPTQIVDALINNQIDAGQTWNPHVYRLKAELGDNAVVLLGQDADDPDAVISAEETFLLLTTDAWLGRNRQAAGKFLRALVRAEQFVADHPQQVKRFISKQFGRDRQYVDYVFPKVDFTVALT